MEIGDLVRAIPHFASLPHIKKVKAFAWHIHTHRKQDRFTQADVRALYFQLHFASPENMSQCFAQLQSKKPAVLLKDKRGYRLEGQVREAFDKKYGTRPLTIVVDTLLAELPGKIPGEAERLFLAEAISCFRVKAYRAAIVMTWNVAYDHFAEWIIRNHLAAFNARIAVNYPKKSGVVIKSKEDFGEQLKESEAIEIAKSSGVLSDGIKKVMSDKLVKRNLAAHPTLLEITQYQAEDVISDLVNNVVLKLK